MQLDEPDSPGTPFLLLKVNDKQASYLAKASLQFTLVESDLEAVSAEAFCHLIIRCQMNNAV